MYELIDASKQDDSKIIEFTHALYDTYISS